MSKFEKLKICSAYLIICIVIIYPLLNTGFAGDDTLHSLIKSVLALNNETVFDHYISNLNTWKSSRLVIPQIFFFLFLLIGGNLIALKIFVSFIFILCCIVFQKLIIKVTNNNDLALIGLISIPAIIQFREYGDPLLAFYGITPLSILGIFLSVYYLIEIFNKPNLKNIFLCNLIILLSSQLYEYNVIIIFSILVLFIGRRFYILRYLWPSIFLIIAYVIATVYFRLEAIPEIDGAKFHEAYSLSTNINQISKTFLISIKSSLPLAHFYYNIDSYIKLLYNYKILLVILLTASLFIIIIFCKYYCAKNINKINPINLNYSIYASLILIIIPTILISISPKYQNELKLGYVYTNSLYISFGFSILIIYLFYILNNSRTKYKKLILLVFITLITFSISINFINNLIVEKQVNSFWKNPRQLAQNAMDYGIFDGVGSNPIIISGKNYPWSIAPFITEYTGIRPNQEFYQAAPGMFFTSRKDNRSLLIDDKGSYINSSNIVDQFKGISKYFVSFDGQFYNFNIPVGSNIYYFDYFVNGNANYAYSCNIRKLSANQDKIQTVLCDDINIYLEYSNNLEMIPNILLNIINIDEEKSRLVKINNETFKVLKSKNNKILIKYQTKDSRILFDTLSLDIALGKMLDRKSNYSSKVNSKDNTYSLLGPVELNKNYYEFNGTSNSHKYSIDITFSLDSFLNSLQPEFAHIIGNHPGSGYDGFVLQKKFLSNDIFLLSYGDGQRWNDISTIRLDDKKLHNLKLFINKSSIIIYIDGKYIGSYNNYSPSSLPIQIGGLASGSRDFIGILHDLKIKTFN